MTTADETMTPIVRTRGLLVGHAGRAILPPIDMDFAAGSVTAILGRNGAGKSTLLQTLLGALPPIEGSIERCRTPLRIALMPQAQKLDFQLPITVREFVSWGSLVGQGFLRRPWNSATEIETVETALGALGLTALGNRFLSELSVGQQQRVLFARVMATQADLALLDEPTAAMDLVFQREVMASLQELAKARSMAVVVVTHALSLISQSAECVLFLDAEAGAVVCGPRAEVMASHAFQRQFGIESTGGGP
ncbi:MAG: metal ABC transporter ATP-binding protein [Myxococcales bacterium]|jgi:zinc transport system ATP-binding protein|nr:metal ABC transporter ATP-binding protein [Myxococcales bacterium]